MANFPAVASLALATSDLRLVQDLIAATRPADEAERADLLSARSSRSRQDSCECNPCRATYPNPIYAERRAAPHECREIAFPPPPCPPILHARPRLALEPASDVAKPIVAAPSGPKPIWRTLPDPAAHRPIVIVKVTQVHTDIASKGMLLDVFI